MSSDDTPTVVFGRFRHAAGRVRHPRGRWRRTLGLTVALLLAGYGVAWAATPSATNDDAAILRQVCQAALRGQLSTADRTWAERCARVGAVAGGILATPGPSPSGSPSPTATPGPSGSPTPTSSPSPTDTPSPTSSPSPSPTAVPSPTPTPSPTSPTPGGCPAFPAFPDASCTGWQHTGVALHNCSVPFGQVETDGAVFDSCYFASGLVIKADNVTIKRSMIHGTVNAHWSSNYTLRGLVMTDVEIEVCSATTIAGAAGCGVPNPSMDHNSAAIAGGEFTCTRCHVHNTDTGVHMGNGANLIDSYMHDFDYTDGDHGAGVGMGLGTGYHSQIIHNNIDCARLAGQPQICSSALSIYDEPLIDDVLVQSNLFNTVGAYCTYGGWQGGTNIRFIDNVYGRKYYPRCGAEGPTTAFVPSNPGNVFSGNVYPDGTSVGDGT